MAVLTLLVIGWCGLSVPLSVAVARLMRDGAGALGGAATSASSGSTGHAA